MPDLAEQFLSRMEALLAHRDNAWRERIVAELCGHLEDAERELASRGEREARNIAVTRMGVPELLALRLLTESARPIGLLAPFFVVSFLSGTFELILWTRQPNPGLLILSAFFFAAAVFLRLFARLPSDLLRRTTTGALTRFRWLTIAIAAVFFAEMVALSLDLAGNGSPMVILIAPLPTWLWLLTGFVSLSHSLVERKGRRANIT